MKCMIYGGSIIGCLVRLSLIFSWLVLAFACTVQTQDKEDKTYFYDEKFTVGPYKWRAWGEPHTKSQELICKASIEFDDGSYFIVGKKMESNLIYFFVHNVNWNITGPVDFPFVMKIQVNAHKDNGQLFKHGEMTSLAANKNSVMIGDLRGDDVWAILTGAGYLRFIMPGDISNAKVPGFGGPGIASRLGACIQLAKKRMDDGESAFGVQKKKAVKDDGGI